MLPPLSWKLPVTTSAAAKLTQSKVCTSNKGEICRLNKRKVAELGGLPGRTAVSAVLPKWTSPNGADSASIWVHEILNVLCSPCI